MGRGRRPSSKHTHERTRYTNFVGDNKISSVHSDSPSVYRQLLQSPPAVLPRTQVFKKSPLLAFAARGSRDGEGGAARAEDSLRHLPNGGSSTPTFAVAASPLLPACSPWPPAASCASLRLAGPLLTPRLRRPTPKIRPEHCLSAPKFRKE